MMMTVDAIKISLLMDIASKAIDADERESQRRLEDDALGASYYEWKEANGITQYIERDTPEWTAMMAATSAEYEALQIAKNHEANAKRRLKTAVRKYRNAVYAERRASAGLDPIDAA